MRLIALGILVRPTCAILIFATGVVVIHWQVGFFIIGPGEGGRLDDGPAGTLARSTDQLQPNRP